MNRSLVRFPGFFVVLSAVPWGLTVATPVWAEPELTVEVQTKPGNAWKPYPTRTLDDLPDVKAANPGYGLEPVWRAPGVPGESHGLLLPCQARRPMVAGRPEGRLFIHRAVVSVSPLRTPGAQDALKAKFGHEAAWAADTTDLLRSHGFNGLGAWSDTERLRAVPRPLVYTRIWNFMSSYGKKRGGTYQQPGHTGYPNDCIFVFDPEFEAFCDQHASQLSAGRDDPWLLGHFSDNELPLKRSALKNYLSLPADDPGHQAAFAWLQARHGTGATAQDITEMDERDFLAFVVDRYHRIVSGAIKKYDSHHLFLGSRFHGPDLDRAEIFRAAGPYLDVVAVNYYRAWSPDPKKLATWERESGRPILITEWYAKGADSGFPNTGGAGWIVRTQVDRGRFYQNFALGLLESKVCVGWHWFKYADNDPADTKADPSNRDSNKGIVNARYEPYPPLLDAMRQLNERAYTAVKHFDARH